MVDWLAGLMEKHPWVANVLPIASCGMKSRRARPKHS